MKRKLGLAMFVAPFVGIAVMGALSVGVWQTLAVFVGTAALIAWIGIAVHLAESP